MIRGLNLRTLGPFVAGPRQGQVVGAKGTFFITLTKGPVGRSSDAPPALRPGEEVRARAVAVRARNEADAQATLQQPVKSLVEKNIGLAYLPPGMWEPGTAFDVEIRGRREGAIVVPTPFYKRAR